MENNLKWWQRWIEAVYIKDGIWAILAVIVTVCLIVLGGLVVVEQVLGWDVPALLGWL